jgi:anti-sigma B factor antagonist
MQTDPHAAAPAHSPRMSSSVWEAPNWGLTVRREGDAVVVGVHGELDLATAPELRSGLVELIEHQGASTLIIDLRSLDFIGATGLGVLVEAQRRLRRRGGTVVLTDPTPIARRVLDLTGLNKAFQVCPHEVAIADARRRAPACPLALVPRDRPSDPSST